MILLLDIGNTRSKLAWQRGASMGEVDLEILPAVENSELEATLAQILAAQSGGKLAVACVATHQLAITVVKQARASGWQAVQIYTERQCAGVTNSYRDVSTMGIDRWLAMIGAWQHCQQSVLVLDLGTALTADVVDSDGLHRGGWIVPGFELMLRSLEQQTSRVFRGDQAVIEAGFGQDTGSCLQLGCRSALLATMQLAFSQACELLGEAPQVFLTGGGLQELPAAVLTSRFAEAEVRPALVLEGLAACAETVLLTE